MRIQSLRLAGVLAIALLCQQPCVAEEEPGFQSLFDGKTLSGWEGDPKLWRVRDGVIRGVTTDSAPLADNQFLIWEGEVSDFILQLEFRIADRGAGNSGVQYRSHRVPEAGPWVVGGYQVDIERTNKYMGILYEERGRGIVALRGEEVLLRPQAESAGKKPQGFTKEVTGQVGDPVAIVHDVRAGEWQTLEVSAVGNEHSHKLNGRPTVRVIDEDEIHAAKRGLVALQLHKGPPMQIEFRNIRLKDLSNQQEASSE